MLPSSVCTCRQRAESCRNEPDAFTFSVPLHGFIDQARYNAYRYHLFSGRSMAPLLLYFTRNAKRTSFSQNVEKTPEVCISANRINDSAPDVNPEFVARVLPAALQFCRCGGLWNAKGHPDGFLSHDPSLRNFRLGRFFDSLIPVHRHSEHRLLSPKSSIPVFKS